MISAIVPAYNEEDAIGRVIEQLRAALAGVAAEGYEIIVVDDGSSDGTAAIAAAAGARVLHHAANVGYGKSLKDGILAARHDTVLITDADLTYPVDQLPSLLAEYRKGFDMVVGARSGSHFDGSWLKAPLRLLLKLLVEFTTGRRIPDVNSGLRLIRREAVLGDLRQLCDTFSFTTSLTLAFLMKRRFVSHVPIPYHQRVGRTKVRLIRDGLRTLQYIVQAIVYYNPLKIFLLVSLACVAVSLLALGLAATARWPIGYLLSGAGLLAAFLVFGLGLLAELVRQLLDRERS